MKTLYLHIGHGKTGSTALQSFCEENREGLARLGVSFPLTPLRTESDRHRVNGHFLIDDILFSDIEEEAALGRSRRDAALDIVAAAFETHDKVLLSDEHIYKTIANCGCAFLEPLAAHASDHGYGIEVLVYLRRQDRLVLSIRNQNAKSPKRTATNPWGGGLAYLDSSTLLDFHTNLRLLDDFLGHGHITVRTFESARIDAAGGLYADFLSWILPNMDTVRLTGPTGDLHPPVGTTNERKLTCNLQEIMSVVKRSEYWIEMPRSPMRQAALIASEQSNAPRMSMLSAAQSKELVDRYARGNDAVAHEFLHSDGPLFDMSFPETRVWDANNEWMEDDLERYFRIANRRIGRLADEAAGTAKTGSVRPCGPFPDEPPLDPGAPVLATARRLADDYCRRQLEALSRP